MNTLQIFPPQASQARTSAASDEPLCEQVDCRNVPIRVDRERGVIHGVKILGLVSKNGRSYAPAALERSLPLYEGARVNVDHPPRGSAAAPRGYEERIGAVRNIRRQADGLYGDFHFNPKHRLAEQLLWDAEHAPENVGFSHNILARTAQHAGKTVVEEITRVQSVDLVADPATTRGLFEAKQPSAGEFAEDSQFVALRESLAALEAENRELRESLLHQARQRERKVEVDRTLAAAALPTALDTAMFRELCYLAESEAQLQRLIEARRDDARLLAAPSRPRSIEQNRDELWSNERADAASFAAALK